MAQTIRQLRRPIPPRASRKPTDQAWQQGHCVADLNIIHIAQLQEPHTEDDINLKPTRSRVHLAKPFIIGTMFMFGLYLFGTLMVIPIGVHVYRQWHYGDGRVSILKAHVGHQDDQNPTLFLATPFHGHIQVIEFPGGDPKKVQVYALAQVSASEDTAVTLQAEDTNQDGKVDLIVTVETRDRTPFILYNNGMTFQPNPPAQATS